MLIGNTRIESTVYNGVPLIIKHEEENITGSFKDRSISYFLENYQSKNITNFAIASSGNSALSATYFASISTKEIKLDIFLSPNVDKDKLSKMYGYINSNENSKKNISVHFSTKAKSDCFKFCRDNGSVNIKGSTDDVAIVGYESLGKELSNLDIDSIFLTTSSGTSLVGIFNGLTKTSNKLVPIYICQTTKIHPIAGEFDNNYETSDTSIVSCVVDKVAKRKEQVIDIVKQSKGGGFVLSDNEVKEAKEISDKNNWNFSINSSCALAGLNKAIKNNLNISKPLIINSGN